MEHIIVKFYPSISNGAFTTVSASFRKEIPGPDDCRIYHPRRTSVPSTRLFDGLIWDAYLEVEDVVEINLQDALWST